MKERPILFNAEMVRAVLDGRKSQTRRIIKIDSPTLEFYACNPPWPTCEMANGFDKVPCPYGQPGDRLWVRETWDTPLNEDDPCSGMEVVYKATPKYGFNGPWRPSIHMPRWASRITLEIVNVFVERLQDIDNLGAKSEGVDYEPLKVLSPGHIENWYKDNFKDLWNKINGPGAWDKNPWVWIIEFRKI